MYYFENVFTFRQNVCDCDLCVYTTNFTKQNLDDWKMKGLHSTENFSTTKHIFNIFTLFCFSGESLQPPGRHSSRRVVRRC